MENLWCTKRGKRGKVFKRSELTTSLFSSHTLVNPPPFSPTVVALKKEKANGEMLENALQGWVCYKKQSCLAMFI